MMNTSEETQQKRIESASLIMELVRMSEGIDSGCAGFSNQPPKENENKFGVVEVVEPEKRCVFLGKNKDRVREIGIRLNFFGGIDLMDFASRHISVRDRPELNIAWENIGEWNA